MPLTIVRDDITKMTCGAIVNATDSRLSGSGGVDAAIHRAAGPGLAAECRALGGCRPGQAKLTGAYGLPCRYVIHTVGPRWFDGRSRERETLASCYRASLELAAERGLDSVAFPLISAGTFGFPKEETLRVAVREISRFLLQREMQVYLVVHDKGSFYVSKKLIHEVTEYIDECYVEARYPAEKESTILETYPLDGGFTAASAPPPRRIEETVSAPLLDRTAFLEDMMGRMDESFSEMLLRKIDEKGMTDAECYKKANIDRKLFSKIRSDPHYRPSKNTAIAFAIALELPVDEAEDMLKKAGFALSRSNKFDIIIEYFLRTENYDILEINQVLFAFDQSLLGG